MIYFVSRLIIFNDSEKRIQRFLGRNLHRLHTAVRDVPGYQEMEYPDRSWMGELHERGLLREESVFLD